MTGLSRQLDETLDRFPLSCPQELWFSGDQGDQAGFFSTRFIVTQALRITGHIDVAALQEALNDVVVRHEILRTVIVRDADPPYQQVHPPRPVPLLVHDLAPGPGRTADLLVEELITETEQSDINPREVPLLHAVLGRLDDRDSVLILLTHHTACDGWTMQLITRDLAAFYAARTTGRPPELPPAAQHGEYATWQQARITGPAAVDAHAYWQHKLAGGRIFALPTDHLVPDKHTRPYSAHNFVISADVMAATSALARATRSSTFMTMLAALNVLAHHITGTTDVAIDTLTTGRNEPRFQDTAGPFMNFLPLRTDISGCTTFLDILARTRDTCLEAYTHEIPIQHIEQANPALMQPNESRDTTQFIFGMFQSQFDEPATRIAEAAVEVTKRILDEPVSSWIPHGLAWNIYSLPGGELGGNIQYNLEDLDEDTVVNWAATYQRILSGATSEPDRAWKTL